MFALAPTHLASHSLGKKKKKKKPTKKQDNRICNSCNKLQCVLSVLLPDAQSCVMCLAMAMRCDRGVTQPKQSMAKWCYKSATLRTPGAVTLTPVQR